MSYTKNIGRKVKGKLEQVKGDYNQKRGKGIKGGLQKIKGKIDEAVADVHLRDDERKVDDDDM